MLQASCLKVPKKMGEMAIRIVRELNLLNSKLKLQQIDDYLCIPLISEPSAFVLSEFKRKLPNYEISIDAFNEQEKRPLIPLDFLAEKLPAHLFDSIPRAIDFLGDIAIVEIPPELSAYKKQIGEAFLKAHKQTNTVLAKSGAIEGVYRLRDFEIIAGVKKTVTLYREYGCKYYIDVARAYFSPRLSTEHNRVASAVKEGETIVDLFAGVGPFSIPIAKQHKNVRVYAVDVNPDALILLKKNVAVNRVEKYVMPILGDARLVVKAQLSEKADRVIMNLPDRALEFIDVACGALKPEGGIIHYYAFESGSNPLEKAKCRLIETVNRNKRQVKNILLAKTVRGVGPYTWHVVVDVKIN